jgi:hypothetical protein
MVNDQLDPTSEDEEGVDWDTLLNRPDVPWDRVFQNPKGQSEVDRRASLASRSQVNTVLQRIENLEQNLSTRQDGFADSMLDKQTLAWWNQASDDDKAEAMSNPERRNQVIQAFQRQDAKPTQSNPDLRPMMAQIFDQGVRQVIAGFPELATEDAQELFRKHAGQTYGETIRNIAEEAYRRRVSGGQSEADKRTQRAEGRENESSPKTGGAKGSTGGSFAELTRKYADGSATPDEVAQYKKLKRQR